VPTGLDPQQDVAPLPDSWVRRVSMPISRTDPAAAAVGGVIYVFSGGLGDPTARVDAFYPNTTTLVPWRQRASMPEPRGRTNGAAVIDGKIYLSGGYYPFAEDETPVKSKTLYRYIPGTNSWTRLADMPRRSAGGETVAIDGKLYVYVVYGPEGATQSTIYRYDPATNVWAERALPPAVQYSSAAVAVGGKMYVIGGSPDKGRWSPR
jgi:N-acetylneuraminic acid mutarotase